MSTVTEFPDAAVTSSLLSPARVQERAELPDRRLSSLARGQPTITPAPLQAWIHPFPPPCAVHRNDGLHISDRQGQEPELAIRDGSEVRG